MSARTRKHYAEMAARAAREKYLQDSIALYAASEARHRAAAKDATTEVDRASHLAHADWFRDKREQMARELGEAS